MDGVMAAFDVLVKGLLGRAVGWETTPDITDGEWLWLSENHPHMFDKLPKCDGAEEFAFLLREQYQFVGPIDRLNHPNRKFEIEWLTAIPRSSTFKYASQDKILWARRNFPGWDVCLGPYSRDKMNQARIGDILIDDRLDNIKAWVGKGGQGIYHPTNMGFENTMKALAEAAATSLPGLWKDGKKVGVTA
jgi:hypothetical protein